MQKSCEPIKEGVVVIKETTTMKELQELGKKLDQEFGIKCIQIHIHKDEGHDVTFCRFFSLFLIVFRVIFSSQKARF